MNIAVLVNNLFGKNISQSQPAAIRPPLYFLEERKNEPLEVFYLDDNVEKIGKGYINSINGTMFMFGNPDISHFYLIRMNSISNKGKLSAVRQINDQYGNPIYINKDIPYDFENADRIE